MPRPSSYVPTSKPEAPRRDTQRLSMWILFAVAGVAFAVAARWAREREVHEVAAPPQPAPPPALPVPTAAQEPAPEPEATVAKESPAQDLALRSDDKVAEGQGMLEVVAGTGNTIYVDGRLIGSGPVAKVPLAPKAKGEPYEVRVKLRGEDQVRFVVVKEGRLTRLRVAPPWSR